jgi:hypothetical protein
MATRPCRTAKAPAPARPRAASASAAQPPRWSQRVTHLSHALALEAGVFTWDDPRAIARSLRRSAERSRERKTTAFRSAMSMLNFYINRAGRQLSARRRRCLQQAQRELRALYGRPAPRRRTRPR